MKVHEAFEIVFAMAQRYLVKDTTPIPPEKEKLYSEALGVALEYHTSQFVDYACPTVLPITEIIRRRKAWRDALEGRMIPIPDWLSTFPCALCSKQTNLDHLPDGLCDVCRGKQVE